MQKIESHIAPHIPVPQRLSDYAVGIFQTITTRKGIKKAIIKGQVFINHKKGYTGDFISGGELIELFEDFSLKQQNTIELQLSVLLEDDYLAIVNKPAGIEVSGNKKRTLEHALPYNLSKSTQPDALQFPEPIHRLDYPTSGLVLVGKTRSSVIRLNKLFEERIISKTYYAVCIGTMNEFGDIKNPINGKVCHSTYEVEKTVVSEKYGFLHLVKLSPKTGRKHQLRIHMAEKGNPILGDKEYGKEGLMSYGNGMYLHAFELIFNHPVTNKIVQVRSKLPEKFIRIFV